MLRAWNTESFHVFCVLFWEKMACLHSVSVAGVKWRRLGCVTGYLLVLQFCSIFWMQVNMNPTKNHINLNFVSVFFVSVDDDQNWATNMAIKINIGIKSQPKFLPLN